jgi:hypothetical protein
MLFWKVTAEKIPAVLRGGSFDSREAITVRV